MPKTNLDGSSLLHDGNPQSPIIIESEVSIKHKKRRYLPFLPRMYWLIYRKPIYFLILLPSMLPGCTAIISNFCMGKIIDSLGRDDCIPTIKRYSLTLFCFGITSALCTYINYTGWISIGSSIGNKLRAILFKSLMENEVSFFDTHQIGELLTLLTDDAKSVESAFTESKTTQLRCLGQFISSVFVTFSINWILATITFVSVLFSSSLMKLFRQYSLRFMNMKFKCMSKSVTIADEALCNTRIVFSFNQQNKVAERYDEKLSDGCLYDKLARFFNGIGFSLAYVMNWTTVVFTLNIGCYLVVKGKVTPGNLFALTRAAFVGSIGLRNLIGSYHEEEKAIDSSERIFAVADTCPQQQAFQTIQNFQGRIEFRHVWFMYPTRHAWILKDVSFEINPGEICAFVGHSGSGKSTIVQLLLRFYDVNEGTILLDGVPIVNLDPHWVHRVIGVVQQDPLLFATTIRENIRYSKSNATNEQIENAARIALCDKFIRKMPHEYESQVGEKGGTLSGGQRQRIAIARAILKDPVILITDEATSALDSESERKVQLALDEVMKSRTSLIIAHRLGTIRAAKMIFVFETGKLVERGTHEQLIDLGGHYYNLVQRQLNGIPNTTSEEQLDHI